jgi:hypothetical protein
MMFAFAGNLFSIIFLQQKIMLANTASREISSIGTGLPEPFHLNFPPHFFQEGLPLSGDPASFLHALCWWFCRRSSVIPAIEFFYTFGRTYACIRGILNKSWTCLYIVRNEFLIMCRHLCFELHISPPFFLTLLFIPQSCCTQLPVPYNKRHAVYKLLPFWLDWYIPQHCIASS